MKTIFLVAGLCAIALATPTKSIPKKHKIDDKVFLERQKNILRLLENVNQPALYKDLVDIASAFAPDKHVDMFTKPEAVRQFMNIYNTDVLPKGAIFSVMTRAHLEQVIPLFEMMHSAKDFDVFYKTAVWARQHVNEGMFLYAVSVAIVHRPDTCGIVLPPIYEVYPYYFFPSEVMTKAQILKQTDQDVDITNFKKADVTKDQNANIIKAELAGWYLNLNDEQCLSYFTEDVGLNAFYYYYNIFYPYWLGGDEYNLKNDRRGEMFYYIHQQLLARYYMERLSNDFGQIPAILKDAFLVETGYVPSLRYPNGLEFPTRPELTRIDRRWESNQPQVANYTDAIVLVEDYERRIRDAIDMRIILTKDAKPMDIFDEKGFDVLGNVIEANADSVNADFYGNILVAASKLFGRAPIPLAKDKMAPSALEHFETAMRDPAWWQMIKELVNLFQRYKSKLPSYSSKDLVMEGVKVEGLKVDRLITYEDEFVSDVTNGIYLNKKELETELDSLRVQMKVRQPRLNHKAFTYTIDVDSGKEVKAVVRVFIGPKRDEYGRVIDINMNRLNFFEFDKFVTNLKAGKNAIVRSSQQSVLANDRTSYRELYTRVMDAHKGKEQLQLDGSESYFGIPKRLLLPSGKIGGQTFQLYVIITPSTSKASNVEEDVYPMVGTGGFNMVDDLPLGFPFDRHIDLTTFKHMPNSIFQDVTIYHKKMEDFHATE